MIHLLTANDERFKTLTFTPGLNIILADRTDHSTDLQTRNGSGKSSLVRLVHFMLGANASTDSVFRKPALESWTFAMGFDLANTGAIVARTGSEANRHLLLLSSGEYTDLNLTRWRSQLAQEWFNLGSVDGKYKPSVRSLLSYLARQEQDGGFNSPFKNSYVQQAWDSQVAVSFFLNLDWLLAAAFEEVRDQEKSVDALRKAAKDGTLGTTIGTVAALRTELAVARREAEGARKELKSFRVIEQYSAREREADDLTRQLRELRDQDAIDRDLIADLDAARAEEAPPGADELERLWSLVNLTLPEDVRSTYDDVRRFHESVIANRASYLSREASQARERIGQRAGRRAVLDGRRSELMQVLSSGGALEQFLAVQAEVGRLEGRVEELHRRFEIAEQIESSKVKVDNARRELLLRLQEDYHDRAEILDEAISTFEEYSQALYDERGGSLVVRESLTGPKFDVTIMGRGSVGIDSMQILCFDFTVMTLCQQRHVGPGVLIHDSHMFDGVDERQVSAALALGARLADEHGFQYIVTLNSDSIPETFSPDFDFFSHVNAVRLTDATEDGGLFGIRFQ